jgi:hypothetical protein
MKTNHKEKSFTLIETIIAVGILATMLVQVISVQGNSIYFSEYAQNVTKGVWLANRVMANVEYIWSTRDFADIKEVEEKDAAFEGIDGFKYNLTIKDWKLPLLDLLSGGAGGATEEGGGDAPSSEEKGQGDIVKGALQQILGNEELLKVANVEVTWAEGAKQNEVTLTYLMTNQRKVNEAIGGYKSAFDKIVNSGPPGAGGATPTPTPPGAPGAPPSMPRPTPTI